MIALWMGLAHAGQDWRADAAASVVACATVRAPCEAADGLVLRESRAGFLFAQDDRLADPAVIGPLLARLVAEPDPRVRVGLADGLVQALGEHPGTPWDAAWVALASEDPQPEVRSLLVNAMRRAPAAVAVPGLRSALAHADARTRADAAATMGGHAEARGFVPDLSGALGDPETAVRAAAARALRWAGGDAALQVLRAHAADPDPAVRAEVVRALGG